MFSPSYLEGIPIPLEKAFRELEIRIMEDIVRRLKNNAGEIIRSADWQIYRLHELGESKEAIREYIKDALNLSEKELEKIYSGPLAEGYAYDEALYKAVGKDFIRFEDNEPLQQLIRAVIRQTNSACKNITQSLGFAVKKNGVTSFTPLADFYQQTLDGAVLDIASGAFDYNTVLKRTVKELTNSGLRTVDYVSGYSSRVPVAARRAVMTGFNQTVAKINDDNARELETDTFEVTWHSGHRPSHWWGGGWYTKQELVSVCGLGSVDGLCGANCYHNYYPVIPGVSVPTYAAEELEQMRADELKTTEYDGKEYTKYEALQRQRRLETKMRAQRQEINLLKEGGADEDDIIAARCRYRGTSAEYVRFSEAMGIPQQRERVTVDGLGNIGAGKWKKTVENNAIKTNSSLDNAVKKSQNNVSSPLVNKSVKKSSNTVTNSVANSVENDIIKDVKELSLSNLSEFEDWQAGYYKINNGVSFSREDNPTIYRYTGGDYDIINALERGGEQLDKVKRNYGEQYVESLKGSGDKISAELSKFKLNTPLRLKRSVGKVDYITGATSPVEDMQKMIGKTFTEKGFTSTTICMDAQLPFGGYNESTRTTLEIIIPKDTKGAYVYKISDSPTEFEFLIDKNTTYKVIDAGEREISVKDYKGNESKKNERYMVLKVIKQ